MWKWCLAVFMCVYYVLVVGSLVTPAYGGQPQDVLSDQTVVFPTYEQTPDPNDILLKLNEAREATGLKPLIPHAELGLVAQARANDMHIRSYYAHINPEGLYYYDLLREAGIRNAGSCENLNLSSSHSSQTYVDDWLQSPNGHKECALDSTVTHAGYAVIPVDPQAAQPSYIVVAIHAALTAPATAAQ
jgi:uncharacterized protein YkwD